MFYRKAVRSLQSFRAWRPEVLLILCGDLLACSLTIASTGWVKEGAVLPSYWGSEVVSTQLHRAEENSTKWRHTQQRRFNSVSDYIVTGSTCYWSACSSAFRWRSTRLRTVYEKLLLLLLSLLHTDHGTLLPLKLECLRGGERSPPRGTHKRNLQR